MTQDELRVNLTKALGSRRAKTIMDELLAIDAGLLLTPNRILKIMVDDVLNVLCPHPCAAILESFWETEAGQLIAQAQQLLYAEDYITTADAARMIYGKADAHAIMSVQHLVDNGAIKRYRRPTRDIKSRPVANRVTEKRTSRAWMLRRSEVESLIAQRKNK